MRCTTQVTFIWYFLCFSTDEVIIGNTVELTLLGHRASVIVPPACVHLSKGYRWPLSSFTRETLLQSSFLNVLVCHQNIMT